MPVWVEWPKDGQLFVDVSSRLGCLFWGRVERRESNAEAMGDCQASHWVFMVLISLKCQPGLRSCTRLFYKRISLQSSDLDKISLLLVLATKVRRSNIMTEAVVVHILIIPDSDYTLLAWFWHERLMSGVVVTHQPQWPLGRKNRSFCLILCVIVDDNRHHVCDASQYPDRTFFVFWWQVQGDIDQ